MTVYIDTSAAAKLIVEESESPALSAYLDGLVSEGVPLVSGVLLETELRRLAVRRRLNQTAVSDVLDRFDLFEPHRAIFVEAGVLLGRESEKLGRPAHRGRGAAGGGRAGHLRRPTDRIGAARRSSGGRAGLMR